MRLTKAERIFKSTWFEYGEMLKIKDAESINVRGLNAVSYCTRTLNAVQDVIYAAKRHLEFLDRFEMRTPEEKERNWKTLQLVQEALDVSRADLQAFPLLFV